MPLLDFCSPHVFHIYSQRRVIVDRFLMLKKFVVSISNPRMLFSEWWPRFCNELRVRSQQKFTKRKSSPSFDKLNYVESKNSSGNMSVFIFFDCNSHLMSTTQQQIKRTFKFHGTILVESMNFRKSNNYSW